LCRSRTRRQRKARAGERTIVDKGHVVSETIRMRGCIMHHNVLMPPPVDPSEPGKVAMLCVCHAVVSGPGTMVCPHRTTGSAWLGSRNLAAEKCTPVDALEVVHLVPGGAIGVTRLVL